MLASYFPDDRQIVGIDLAEGMVDLANERCAEAGIRSEFTYRKKPYDKQVHKKNIVISNVTQRGSFGAVGKAQQPAEVTAC